MNNSRISATVVIVLLQLAMPVQAAQPDPMDANVLIPPLQYRAVFADYHGYQEAKIGSGRDFNASVSFNAAGKEYPAEQPMQAPLAA